MDAEKSDLFDVLAYIVYALPTLTREQRADMVKVEISSHFNVKQQAFLDFVLAHYVEEGVQEVDLAKLTPLLRLGYTFLSGAAQQRCGIRTTVHREIREQ